MSWNGTAWRKVHLPSSDGGLNGVAATSARNAWAVGATTVGKPQILRWNGRTWKQVPSPNPSVVGDYYRAVVATSANNAWAVGSTSVAKTLIVRWNGRRWKPVPA